MSVLTKLFSRRQSKSTANLAKDRLQVIISRRRGDGESNFNFLPQLKDELMAVVGRYVNVGPESIKVEMGRDQDIETLEINVALPEANKATAPCSHQVA